MSSETVDPKLYADELEAQRNSLANSLARAGAIIISYRSKVEELQAQVKRLEEANAYSGGTDGPVKS